MQGMAEDGRVLAVSSVSEGEISRIMALKEKCERRLGIGIVLSAEFLRSLEKPGVGALAFRTGKQYLGFAFLYSFEKEEAETCLFADPDYDGDTIKASLLEATIAECKRRGHLRLLVMNDRRLTGGVGLIERNGSRLAFSEHRMIWDRTARRPSIDIGFLEVGNDDAALIKVEMECHGRFYSKPDQRRYLALVDGEPVGKIDVNLEGPDADLTGLCVLPRLRGNGFGKAILQGMVGVQKAAGKERIVLDVQTDNDVALSLYIKSGFEKVFTIDYYEIPLE